jgi:hypothetical protein
MFERPLEPVPAEGHEPYGRIRLPQPAHYLILILRVVVSRDVDKLSVPYVGYGREMLQRNASADDLRPLANRLSTRQRRCLLATLAPRLSVRRSHRPKSPRTAL